MTLWCVCVEGGGGLEGSNCNMSEACRLLCCAVLSLPGWEEAQQED